MATVGFSQNIQTHVSVEQTEVSGGTVREALEEVFAAHDKLRSYVLDDRGELRRHVAIVIDGESLRDRAKQSDPIEPHSDIFVMQALSGG